MGFKSKLTPEILTFVYGIVKIKKIDDKYKVGEALKTKKQIKKDIKAWADNEFKTNHGFFWRHEALRVAVFKIIKPKGNKK